MEKFIGRKKELAALKGLLQKKNASLVVIRGRRRIGKSRLAEEFAKTFSRSIILSGIPPSDGVNAQMQREEFLRQLQEHQLPVYRSDDWGNLFFDLSEAAMKGRVLIVLDEITWMGSKDSTFLPKLKTAWDRHFKKNNKLILIISGSNSAWIQKNILSSTGFYGRVSLRILLDELSLSNSNDFWDDWPGVIDPYEKFKVLSVTGGIPRYLEELRPDLSAENNIQHLCFEPEGLLFREFDQIFHDLFLNRGTFYKQIVQLLVDHHLSLTEIAKKTGRTKGGDLSEAVDELAQAGFISRDYTWQFSKNKKSKISRYRLRDNYLRFYLKYIQPNREQIEGGKIRKLPPGWYSILGLQFENLVVNNGALVQRILGIPIEEVVFSAPYLQTPRSRRKGCQIDYLIQTKFNTIYICEVKFSQGKIGIEVITEMKEKLNALQLPKGFSMRPILIHVNGVDERVVDSGFFARIIDFSELLTCPND
ncbi:MAG: ATP-binding protein [Rhabdochlamydiaceae bacterium]|nr:ATP-binding protein [Rhabdochlamydiaceae bacterium]